MVNPERSSMYELFQNHDMKEELDQLWTARYLASTVRRTSSPWQVLHRFRVCNDSNAHFRFISTWLRNCRAGIQQQSKELIQLVNRGKAFSTFTN